MKNENETYLVITSPSTSPNHTDECKERRNASVDKGFFFFRRLPSVPLPGNSLISDIIIIIIIMIIIMVYL